MKGNKYKSWECQQCGGGLKLWFAQFFMGLVGNPYWHKCKPKQR